MDRVEVIKHKNVNQFGPPIPSPPLFDDKDLKSFLTLKCNNQERKHPVCSHCFYSDQRGECGLEVRQVFYTQ